MSNLCIVGLQWGDEGKGKLVDVLAEEFDVVVRFQGGGNAGHTVVVDGEKYVVHLVPSGVFRPGAVCVIGNGVVVDPASVVDELDELAGRGLDVSGKLLISDRAHMVFPYHKILDRLDDNSEGKPRIGTTGRGIGPCYADKASRQGIRAGEMLDRGRFAATLRQAVERKNRILVKLFGADPLDPEAVIEEYLGYADKLAPMVADSVEFLNDAMDQGKRILFEGAQAALLDIDYGTYPFTTSSNTTTGGVATGAGISPKQVGEIVGVAKAYTTRVGEGPFPTELDDATGEGMRERGGEFGATTGRPRRCGWLDAVALRYATRICGADSVALTKLDVLGGEQTVRVCVEYRHRGEPLKRFPSDVSVLEGATPVYRDFEGWTEDISAVRCFGDLPEAARRYVAAIEDLVGLPVSSVGVGSGREQIVRRNLPGAG